MGRYSLHDSDEDRRRSRKERDRKYRRTSRSRSRSRGRSPRDKKREHARSRHNTRSRSRERRRRSRERYRETKGGRDRRHRSSSKSRRGRYSDSKSRSRSRSRGRRSRSSSIDTERKRQKDKNERSSKSKRASSKSKTSVKNGDLQNDDDDAGMKNSKLSIPSADDLAKIESDSFVPEMFVSQRSKKGGSEDTINSHQNQSHEDAIFGVSGRVPLTTNTAKNESNEIPCERRTEGSGIMASLLHELEESKNDRWIKKLHSMRQKKLQSNSEPLLS